MRVVRWQALTGHGLEHLVMEWGRDGVRVDSVVIGQHFGALYGLQYRIECTPHWLVEHVSLQLTGGSSLSLRRDRAGHWHDDRGHTLPELDGCIDVDISATPFTHTLPLQRLKLADHAPHVVRIAHISVPDLELRAVEYAYTCVQPGSAYTCRGIFRDLDVPLNVDEDGIVLDYPPLFKRTR